MLAVMGTYVRRMCKMHEGTTKPLNLPLTAMHLFGYLHLAKTRYSNKINTLGAWGTLNAGPKKKTCLKAFADGNRRLDSAVPAHHCHRRQVSCCCKRLSPSFRLLTTAGCPGQPCSAHLVNDDMYVISFKEAAALD